MIRIWYYFNSQDNPLLNLLMSFSVNVYFLSLTKHHDGKKMKYDTYFIINLTLLGNINDTIATIMKSMMEPVDI